MKPIEIAKAYYQAFNQQNWQEMLNLVSEHIIHEPNESKTRVGKDLFSAFLQKMDFAYQEELKDMMFFQGEIEGRIAVEFVVHGIYKQAEDGLPAAHGQSYMLPAGAFLSIENGKIQRITTFYNLEEWIAQVSTT